MDSIYLGQEQLLDEDQPSVQSTIDTRFNSDGIAKDITSRTIPRALRHSPELYRLNMDNDGWVNSVEIGHVIHQLTGTDPVPGFD